VTPAGVQGACVLALILLAQGAGAAVMRDAARDLPPRPAACREVGAGESLEAALAEAEAGASLCLAPGDHAGPLRFLRRVTLWGPREAVIHSQGHGTTLSVEADGTALLGFSVDGSGGRFDLSDAALRVRADDVRVEGVSVRNALFGILADRSSRLLLRGNEIVGVPGKALGLRGDGIRLWEVRDSRIEGNRLADSRDIVIWYSPGNHTVGNLVERGRYGTHFMYSHDNVVEGNRYVENVVGIFVMYSHGIAVRRNDVIRSEGAAGVGLGLKDSDDIEVTDNRFLGNRIGAFVDSSPLSEENWNEFRGNLFHLGETAISFHGGTARNRFSDNSFRDQHQQVSVDGGGDAREAAWIGNYYDDYAGYDLDGDGVGDLPYELRSFTGALVAREPSLRFFRGSLAIWLIERIGQAVPLFPARTLLVDAQPRMHPAGAGALRAD
jgi:nitrous oxidase accessory protein